MIKPALKSKLLLSLIILNLGSILLILLFENNPNTLSVSNFNPSTEEKLKIGFIISFITAGIIFFFYSLKKIMIDNKERANSESLNHQDS